MAINSVNSTHASGASSAEARKDTQKSLTQLLQSNKDSGVRNALSSDTALHANFSDKMHAAKEKASHLFGTLNRKLSERRLSFGANNLRAQDSTALPESELEDAHKKMYGDQKSSLPKIKQAFRRGLRQSIGQITQQEERTEESLKDDLKNANDNKVNKLNNINKSSISDSQIDKEIDKKLGEAAQGLGAKANDPTARFLLLANQEQELDPKQDAKLIAGIKRAKNKLIAEHGDRIEAKYNSQDVQAKFLHHGKYERLTQFEEIHYELTRNPSIFGAMAGLLAFGNLQKQNGQIASKKDWIKHVSLSVKTSVKNASGSDNFKNLKFDKGKNIYKTQRVHSHQQTDLSTGVEQNALSHQHHIAAVSSYLSALDDFLKKANAQSMKSADLAASGI
jgi:hypothetical protein